LWQLQNGKLEALRYPLARKKSEESRKRGNIVLNQVCYLKTWTSLSALRGAEGKFPETLKFLSFYTVLFSTVDK
jgi:hypothetical protein